MNKNLLFIFIILSAEFVFAKTMYVSNTGNDSNTGTYASPYKTITKAVSSAVSGDTILVRGGVHSYTSTITISKSGTSSLRYYLLAYPNERPILDFTGQSSGSRGVSLTGNYWHIYGIDFCKSGDNAMNISGSYNTVEFCSFYENLDTGLQLGGGASNNQIINCDSYFNKDASDGNADGFAPKLTVGTGNYFYGCRAWQNSDDGWDGYLRGANDVTTTLENCWCFANGYLKSGAASSGNGNGFKMGGSDDKTLMHNFVLKKCVAFDNRVKGFDQNNNKGSMTLLNCTGYRNGTNYSISQALNTGKALTVTNSAALGSYGSLGAFAVQTTNSWMAPFSVSAADFLSTDTTGMRGPRNADGSLPNLPFMQLAATSDLIDGGTNVGLAYYGSAPDLGAFEYNPSPGVPTVLTSSVSGITTSSAACGGNVTSAGGSTVTVRGVCWNTTGSPTIANSKTTDGSGTGTFTSSITGLSAGTTYYVRAYAANSTGTAYGAQVSFTTNAVPVLPTISTTNITAITNTSAGSGGNVTSEGNATVTARGVCWNTSGTPTVTDFTTSDGTGSGVFSSSLTGLLPNTTYYVRAYATNSVGTAYGSSLSFTTTNTTYSLPVLSTAAVSGITTNSALSGGTITSDGGASVTSRGVCWNTSGTPTIADNFTTDGTGSGTFSSAISGLSASTHYYVRAYATNTVGTAYGSQEVFTTTAQPAGIVQGFNQTGVWPSSAPTTEVSVSVSGQGTWLLYQAYQVSNASYICDASAGDLRLLKIASPYTGGYGISPTLNGVGEITFVEGRGNRTVTVEKSTDNGATWSTVQAFATTKCSTAQITVNDAAINRIRFRNASTSDIDIDNVTITAYASVPVLPTVSTTAAASITQTSAAAGGIIAADGGATIFSRGVCWSTGTSPDTSNSKTNDGAGSGTFSSSITGLSPSTTYYYRAYAINSVGIAYGSILNFSTTGGTGLPVLTTSTVTNILTQKALSGGTVSSQGGSAVTARGVCWNLTGSPSISEAKTVDGAGAGSFASTLSGLSENTTYFARAYATNGEGTAYGNEVSFTTRASVIFNNVSGADITQFSAWGTNTDGTGDKPLDFSSANSLYRLTNGNSVLQGNLSISGSGSKFVLGNGSQTVSLTIPSDKQLAATIDINAGANLILQSLTYPSFGVLAGGSTVTFDGAAPHTIPAAAYSNLVSANDAGSSRTLASTGTIFVSGQYNPGNAAYTVTGSTVSFNGSASQNIPAATFYNVQFDNTSGALLTGNVFVSGQCSVNQNVTVPVGDTLFLSGSTPLTVASAKSLTVVGAVQNLSTGTVTLSGTLQVNDGGAYIVNANVSNSYNVPVISYNSAANLVILQGIPRINQSSIAGNVYWAGSGGGTLMGSSLSSMTIGGDFTIVSGKLNNGSGGTSRALTVNGNLRVLGGEYHIAGSPGSSSGNQVTTVNGNLEITGGKLFISAAAAGTGTLNVKGTVSHTAGEFGDSLTNTNGTLNLNGTALQSFSTVGLSNAFAVIVNNSAGITLQSNAVLNGNLTLTSGKIFLNNRVLTLSAASALSGTFSASRCFVAGGTGELRKEFSSAGSFVFPIGDTSGTAEYSPITLTFTSGTFQNASVGARMAADRHPLNNSQSHYLRRYWQLSQSGVSSFSANIKSTFTAADVSGTRSTQFIGRWDGSKWYKLDQLSTVEDTLRVNGLTAFGDFTAGESDYVGGANQYSFTLIPQAMYNSSSNTLSIRDTFKVYAASAVPPYGFQDSSIIVLNDSTFLGKPLFRNAPDGNYYFVIKGRNTLETWSGAPLPVVRGAIAAMNLTDSASAAFGNNLHQVNGKWCIFSGDLNQDGIIDFTDLSAVDNASLNYLSGYVTADVTGDNFVDFSDVTVVDNNSLNFITLAKPGMSAQSVREGKDSRKKGGQ